MTKLRKSGSQVGASSARKASRARKKKRQQVRRAIEAGAGVANSSSNASASAGGTLTRDDAFRALSDMGIAVNNGELVDITAARNMAEGAAASAAATLGINIISPDGSIDTNAARRAVSEVLGFDIDDNNNPRLSELTGKARDAAVRAAESLGADILDSNGELDSTKASQVAQIALNLRPANARPKNRRKAAQALGKEIQSLHANLDALAGGDELSRRAASDAVDKLLSASVLIDGRVDGREPLLGLEAALN